MQLKKIEHKGFELTPQVKRYPHLNNCVMRSSLVMSNNLNIAKCSQLLIEMLTQYHNLRPRISLCEQLPGGVV